MIYRDISIVVYRKQFEDIYFRRSKAETAKGWRHNYNPGHKFCVRVPIGFLEREDILLNMLHCIIHMHNKEIEKEDMNTKGRYHMVAFKESANGIGVTCSYTKNYGYQIENCSKELREECLKIIDRYYTDIKAYKEILAATEKASEVSDKSNAAFVPYICPVCKKVIRASEDSLIICAIDQALFQRK